MKKDFSHYAWSLRTLDRRLRWFHMYRTDPTMTEEALRTAVTEELDGPGKLGYRAMTNKIRQEHNLKVPRRVIHAMMYDVNPEGLQQRALENRKKPPCKRTVYDSRSKLGPLFGWALQAHGLSKRYLPFGSLRLS